MAFRSTAIRLLAAGFVGTCALCLSARAVPIAPNQTLPATGEADPTGGSVVGGPLASTFSGGAGPTAFSGTLTTKVISGDPSNPLGGLTFTFQLSNDASSQVALSRITTQDFTGFLTDVSYQTPAAGTTPFSVDRNTAAVMGWTYSAAGGGQIANGASSAVMVVQTNAQGFGNITANILGGAGATAASFGPVPEPAMLGLLSVGAMLFCRRRA